MDWQTLEQNVQALASKITEAPDIIVAVARGGLVPARLLAKQFGVNKMYVLTINKQGDDQIVVTKIMANLAGKKVLLVEDALESGKSLKAAQSYLKSLGASVETAALYATFTSGIKPDYFISRKARIPPFPWD